LSKIVTTGNLVKAGEACIIGDRDANWGIKVCGVTTPPCVYVPVVVLKSGCKRQSVLLPCRFSQVINPWVKGDLHDVITLCGRWLLSVCHHT
jgi:hypothetical protein